MTQDIRQAAEELNRVVRRGDPLSQMERDILGEGGIRLHMELRDPIYVRETIVPILRTLANDLEIASHIRGPALTALFACRMHIRKATNKLRSRPHRNNG